MRIPFQRKEMVYHKFRCVNYSDYELLLKLNCKSEIFNKIFQKSKIALRRKQGINTDGNPENIEEFEVPNTYYNVMKV